MARITRKRGARRYGGTTPARFFRFQNLPKTISKYLKWFDYVPTNKLNVGTSYLMCILLYNSSYVFESASIFVSKVDTISDFTAFMPEILRNQMYNVQIDSSWFTEDCVNFQSVQKNDTILVGAPTIDTMSLAMFGKGSFILFFEIPKHCLMKINEDEPSANPREFPALIQRKMCIKSM